VPGADVKIEKIDDRAKCRRSMTLPAAPPITIPIVDREERALDTPQAKRSAL